MNDRKKAEGVTENTIVFTLDFQDKERRVNAIPTITVKFRLRKS